MVAVLFLVISACVDPGAASIVVVGQWTAQRNAALMPRMYFGCVLTSCVMIVIRVMLGENEIAHLDELNKGATMTFDSSKHKAEDTKLQKDKDKQDQVCLALFPGLILGDVRIRALVVSP